MFESLMKTKSQTFFNLSPVLFCSIPFYFIIFCSVPQINGQNMTFIWSNIQSFINFKIFVCIKEHHKCQRKSVIIQTIVDLHTYYLKYVAIPLKVSTYSISISYIFDRTHCNVCPLLQKLSCILRSKSL